MSTPELDYFVSLAIRGHFEGASSGEMSAAALARAVLDYVNNLDSTAQRGLVHLISLASYAPTTAGDLFNGVKSHEA